MSQNNPQKTINRNNKQTRDIEVSSASVSPPPPPPPPLSEEETITPQQPEMITVPRDQYQALLALNMKSFENTLNVLDNLDKILGSLTNMQAFVMNIKEVIKRTQLGMNNNQQQQQPDQAQQQQQGQ